jgi:hypothetical protein
MAAVRTMFSAAREEVAVLSAEVVSSARTGALEAVRGAEVEVLNPLQVRQMAEASVKEVSSGTLITRYLYKHRALHHLHPQCKDGR